MGSDTYELPVIALLFDCCLWVEASAFSSPLVFIATSICLVCEKSSVPPASGLPRLSLRHLALPTPVGFHMVTFRGSVYFGADSLSSRYPRHGSQKLAGTGQPSVLPSLSPLVIKYFDAAL